MVRGWAVRWRTANGKPFLDANYWRNDFAVTDGDLNGLEMRATRSRPSRCGHSQLLGGLVEHKLARECSQAVDP